MQSQMLNLQTKFKSSVRKSVRKATEVGNKRSAALKVKYTKKLVAANELLVNEHQREEKIVAKVVLANKSKQKAIANAKGAVKKAKAKKLKAKALKKKVQKLERAVKTQKSKNAKAVDIAMKMSQNITKLSIFG